MLASSLNEFNVSRLDGVAESGDEVVFPRVDPEEDVPLGGPAAADLPLHGRLRHFEASVHRPVCRLQVVGKWKNYVIVLQVILAHIIR